MSLWESGDSSGEVSLASLLEGGRCVAKDAEQTYSGVASLICRGGWPRMIKMAPDTAQARLRDLSGQHHPHRHLPSIRHQTRPPASDGPACIPCP